MKRGFTLIELLASIVVIAIISLVSIPIITGVVNKTKLNALKVSAENLIDATRLYNAQYNNEETVRFDIANNKITSTDTDKLLKYKGSIKAGTVIVDTKGRSVICVTDGSRSAYKNYSENIVSVSNNKICNIPAGGSIVYLGNEATITELSNQELTQQLNLAQSKIAELETKIVELEARPLANDYSTTEQEIGTYDGRKLYRKIVNAKMPSTLSGNEAIEATKTATYSWSSLGITNVDEIISVTNAHSNNSVLPWIYEDYFATYQTDKSNLWLRSNWGPFKNREYELTITYTKNN
ncbi:MAG: type II secretion system protein [Bacilli bacterium]|nr:type II secretion system protein [Bacilli bacterium]